LSSQVEKPDFIIINLRAFSNLMLLIQHTENQSINQSSKHGIKVDLLDSDK